MSPLFFRRLYRSKFTKGRYESKRGNMRSMFRAGRLPHQDSIWWNDFIGQQWCLKPHHYAISSGYKSTLSKKSDYKEGAIGVGARTLSSTWGTKDFFVLSVITPNLSPNSFKRRALWKNGSNWTLQKVMASQKPTGATFDSASNDWSSLKFDSLSQHTSDVDGESYLDVYNLLGSFCSDQVYDSVAYSAPPPPLTFNPPGQVAPTNSNCSLPDTVIHSLFKSGRESYDFSRLASPQLEQTENEEERFFDKWVAQLSNILAILFWCAVQQWLLQFWPSYTSIRWLLLPAHQV